MGENLLLALDAIRANKMRSLLTMLGIIIGIMSVIAIITIGNALTDSITSELSSFGSSNIMVMLSQKNDGNEQLSEEEQNRNAAMGLNTADPEEKDMFSMEEIQTLTVQYADHIRGVSIEAPGKNGQAKENRREANVTLVGVNPGFAVVNDTKLLSGTFIRESDVSCYRNVAVVSDKMVERLFGQNAAPLGKEVHVYLNNSIDVFTIIGVYQYKTTSFMGLGMSSEEDRPTELFVPVTTAKQDDPTHGFAYFTVAAKPHTDTKAFASEVKNYFVKQ